MYKIVNNFRVFYFNLSWFILLIYSFNFNIYININKICENDTLFNLYTLSSSVFTLWFLLFIIYFLFFRNYKYVNNMIAYVILSYYFFIFSYDCNYAVVTIITDKLNNTLQNGLLNIHPVCIYIVYAYAIIFWFYNYKIIHLFNNYSNNNTKMYFVFKVIILGVYLGSFWASQEFNWGGFWSWDPVELISLFLFFWFLLYFHNRRGYLLNKPINHIILSIFIIYCVLRLGIISTVHSFIRSSSNPVLVSLVSFNFYLFFVFNLFNFYYKYKFNKNIIQKHIIFVNILFLCIYSVLTILKSNLLFINLMQFYSFIVFITLTIYWFYYTKYTKKYNLLLMCALLLYFTMFYNSYYVVFVLICVYVNTIIVKNNNTTHLIMLICYIIFFIYFLYVNNYTNLHVSWLKLNIFLNNLSNSNVYGELYETAVFFKKNINMFIIKNYVSHIGGFSINTNSISSLYLLNKNMFSYSIFSIDSVNNVYIYLIVICILNLTNYKYNYYNSNLLN